MLQIPRHAYMGSLTFWSRFLKSFLMPFLLLLLLLLLTLPHGVASTTPRCSAGNNCHAANDPNGKVESNALIQMRRSVATLGPGQRKGAEDKGNGNGDLILEPDNGAQDPESSEPFAYDESFDVKPTEPLRGPLDDLAISGTLEVQCRLGKGEGDNQELAYSTCEDTDSHETYYLLTSDDIKYIPEGSFAEMTLKATELTLNGEPIYKALRAYSHDEKEVVPEIGEALTDHGESHKKSTPINLVGTDMSLGAAAMLEKTEREDRFFWQRGSCPKGSGPIRTAQACKLAAPLLAKTSQWFDGTFTGEYAGSGYYPRYTGNCHVGCKQKLYFNLDRRVIPAHRDLQVCDREAFSLEELAQSTEATPVDDICPDVRFLKGKIVCDDGTVINDSDGSCCPASSKSDWHCPTTCAGKSRSWSFLPDGSRGYKCYCSECKRAPKVETSENDEWVNAHNYLRCLHGQPLLHWDATVASNAVAPAQACCDAGTLFHSEPYDNTPSSGENLALGYYSSDAATMAWYNEIIDPGYPPGSDEPGGAGHYTALIWKATTKLGCASCKDVKGRTISACHYADGPPNFGGVPEYIQNVPQNSTLDATREACCQYIFNGGATPESRLERLRREAEEERVAAYLPGIIKDATHKCKTYEKQWFSYHKVWANVCKPFTSEEDVVKTCDARADCLGYEKGYMYDGHMKYVFFVPKAGGKTYGTNPNKWQRFMVKQAAPARNNPHYYAEGPRVDDSASEVCSSWYGTLADAKAQCDRRSSCQVLHDFGCDGKNWRYCDTTLNVVQTSGSGTGACTRTKQAKPATSPTVALTEPPTSSPSVPQTESPTKSAEAQIVYSEGPPVDDSASNVCSSWYGTLADAKARCDKSSSCHVLHDYGCDGKNWRYCDTTLNVVQASGSGTGACTRTKQEMPVASSTVTLTETPTSSPSVPQTESPTKSAEAQMVYSEGPPVDDSASEVCSSWYGTLADAKAQCDRRSSCQVLHDYGCDGKNWRYCDTTLNVVQASGSGTGACTKTKHIQYGYSEGPRVDDSASGVCSSWYGTLADAKARCDKSSSCHVLHDYGCDGKNWRYCDTTLNVVQASGSGTGACTMTK